MGASPGNSGTGPPHRVYLTTVSKGKIERFFRTLRAQLLTGLSPQDTASLEALNRRLWGWVEGEYHHSPHRGLDGQTPLERWAQTAQQVRFPEPELDLDALFLFEAIRKVAKDRTVSLNGTLYEVDAALIGERVTLRYDPSAPPGRPIEFAGQEALPSRFVHLTANHPLFFSSSASKSEYPTLSNISRNSSMLRYVIPMASTIR